MSPSELCEPKLLIFHQIDQIYQYFMNYPYLQNSHVKRTYTLLFSYIYMLQPRIHKYSKKLYLQSSNSQGFHDDLWNILKIYKKRTWHPNIQRSVVYCSLHYAQQIYLIFFFHLVPDWKRGNYQKYTLTNY